MEQRATVFDDAHIVLLTAARNHGRSLAQVAHQIMERRPDPNNRSPTVDHDGVGTAQARRQHTIVGCDGLEVKQLQRNPHATIT